MPPTECRLGAYKNFEQEMSIVNRKRLNMVKIGVPVLVSIVMLILLFIGVSIDRDPFYNQGQQSAQSPYIELVKLDGEQFLVGDVVVEWLSGKVDGKELYNRYSSQGKVYSANPVTIQYTIYNIPANVEVESQSVELSEDSSFIDAQTIDLPGNKRSVSFEHLYTDRIYYYRVTAHLSNDTKTTALGQFKTANTPRIISTEGVWNMRDIGGVETLDEKKLRQGLVYRGVELDGDVYEKYCITEEGTRVLTEELGIRTELDLRGKKENTKDMLGPDVKHNVYSSIYAYSDSLISYYTKNYRQLFSDLAKEETYPAYIHCSYGKDRTGTVIFLLQLLLGVSEEDAYREWELSVLLDGVIDYIPMEKYIADLKKLEGDTMQEKVENHLLSIGVTKSEIENIRKILIEDYIPNDTDTDEQNSVLEGKKIVYDGDSIAMGLFGDGGYAQMIADLTNSEMVNFAIGGWAAGVPQRRRELSLGS